jgi:hypothetical protein
MSTGSHETQWLPLPRTGWNRAYLLSFQADIALRQECLRTISAFFHFLIGRSHSFFIGNRTGHAVDVVAGVVRRRRRRSLELL